MVWVSVPLGSYRRVHRCAFLLYLLVLLSACSAKHVHVSGSRSASSAKASELEGLASYYAEPYHGRRTANGEVFDTYCSILLK